MFQSTLTLFAIFAAGLISFFSPCVFPLVPAYLSYLTGVQVDRLRQGEFQRILALRRGLGFVLGFSLVFIIMGASVSYIGQLLYFNRQMITRVGGVIVILAGLYLMGVLPVKALLKEKKIVYIPKNTGIVTSFLLGMAFAMGWTPCVGPILSGVLVYATSSKTMFTGMFMLGIYSLGFAVPFLITALAIDLLTPILKGINRYLMWVSRGSGLILVLLGVLLFFDRLEVLTF